MTARKAVMAVIAGLSLAAPAAAAPPDAAHIGALRADYNAAIARHDFPAMRRFYLPDYTVLPGSSGAPFDIAAMAPRIARDFADPAFVTYVRTPSRIVVADDGARAAESGRWTGMWRQADGLMRVSGVYQATWLPTAAGWRLKNEAFVTLRCRGSRACEAR